MHDKPSQTPVANASQESYQPLVRSQQVANSFAVSRGGVVIADLNSSYHPSTSDMSDTLTFKLLQTPLIVPEE
ncbi:hypothetical protein CPC16_012129 [Podila verticillata]|nr:hypothetical protein CPC16_012129 [Podila verticillata]